MDNIDFQSNKILDNIKVHRTIKKIPAKEMARKLNVSYRSYLYLEEGKTELTVKKLILICNHFEISLIDFLQINYDV